MYFIVINTSYTNIELAIFKEKKENIFKENILIESYIINNKDINKNLLNILDSIFSKLKIFIKDILFIATTLGPGPYNSLRVVISTLNSLNFCSNVKLVGINSIFALTNQYKEQKNNNNVIITLFNAFANDIYYFIDDSDKQENISKSNYGYANYLEFFNMINLLYKDKNITFIGPGATLYKDNILNIFSANVNILDNFEYLSIQYLAKQCYKKYKDNDFSNQLSPIYLKDSIL